MPIYEYRCIACGHELEALQKLSDAPLRICPQCGKEQMSKLVSAAGFQLKGSGWYATDFKNSGAKPAAKDAAKSDAKSDAKADAKSDVKSEGSAAKAETGSAEPAKSESKPKSETSAPPAGTTSGT